MKRRLMPELPDLTIYQRNLKKLLLRNRVKDLTVYRRNRFNTTPDDLSQAITGATLIDIKREGKELQFHFSSGHNLSVHLMLKGQFEVRDNPADIQHKLLSVDFGRPGYLVVSDPKSWATFTLDPEPCSVPDALSTKFDLRYLRQMLGSVEPMTMKAFLIDQKIIRGIGNAYADEILYDCRISPLSSSNKLPDEAASSLFESIRNVLISATDFIYANVPDAINGEYRDFLKVHNPNKTRSPGGFPIHQETISTRNTYFTDEQIIY